MAPLGGPQLSHVIRLALGHSAPSQGEAKGAQEAAVPPVLRVEELGTELAPAAHSPALSAARRTQEATHEWAGG